MRATTATLSMLVLAAAISRSALAQSTQPASVPSSSSAVVPSPVSAQPEEEMIKLGLPENVEIKLLIDYMSKRLDVNILYDQAIAQRRVTIIAPARIPASSLPGLFHSILKISGLTMIDSDQKGWKKIVPSQDMLSITQGVQSDPNALSSAESTQIVTQVFQIRNATIASVDQTIRPFLSKPGGNSFAVPDQGLLIVTDFAGNLRRVSQMIDLVDKAKSPVSMQFIDLKHAKADDIAKQAGDILRERDRLAAAAGGKPSERGLSIMVEPRTNRLMVLSAGTLDAEAIELIRTLDVPTNAETRSYQLKHASPQRIDQLAKEFIGTEQIQSRYKSIVVAESGTLVVTAAPSVHEQIAAVVKQMDVPQTEVAQSNVRFYKLMNATAASVLATIRSLDVESIDAAQIAPETGISTNGGKFTGPNQLPPPAGQQPPPPPFYRGTTTQPVAGDAMAVAGAENVARTRDAVVVADTNTNTLIVVAPPAVQSVYKQLVSILDKRRPQVMVEVVLVTLDTTDDFSLGVDMSFPDPLGGDQQIFFSSFGLSKVDPLTGNMALIPGAGFNGAIINPNNFDVVIRALSTSGRAKVESAPKVLVNDNASATLTSVSEAPFTSINASQTVSTTSFAGYASAGTTISLTPHISEGEHLNMQYSITLNSFTGTGSAGIPPPRQTNSIDSEVTVPNGCTIVVGGLTRKDTSHTASKIPLLGDIPFLGHAFSSHDYGNSKSTLFAFIRPIILRDDEFEDLKYYSQKDLARAELPSDFPCSSPQIMD